MRVDFYVLGQVPAERIVPPLAAKALAAGERMLVVSADAAQRTALSDALWGQDGFLAHGEEGTPHAERQPLLIGGDLSAANDAKLLLIADGQWRESDDFTRIFYLFDDDHRDAARNVWRETSTRDDVEAFFWKQEGGKWRQGP